MVGTRLGRFGVPALGRRLQPALHPAGERARASTGSASTSAAATTRGSASRPTSRSPASRSSSGPGSSCTRRPGRSRSTAGSASTCSIQWLPHFRFSAEISAGLSLSYDGSPVLEVSIDVLARGPRAVARQGLRLADRCCSSRSSLPIDASWGDDVRHRRAPTAQPAHPRPRRAVGAGRVERARRRPGLDDRHPPRAADRHAIPAHPLGVVVLPPAGRPARPAVTHVGNQPLAAPTTVDLDRPHARRRRGDRTPPPVIEAFAAGQFLDLTDDQALSRPSFEPMRAGLAAGGSTRRRRQRHGRRDDLQDGGGGRRDPDARGRRGCSTSTHADAVLRPPRRTDRRGRPRSLVAPRCPTRCGTIAGDWGHAQTASLAAQRAGGRAPAGPGRRGGSGRMTGRLGRLPLRQPPAARPDRAAGGRRRRARSARRPCSPTDRPRRR